MIDAGFLITWLISFSCSLSICLPQFTSTLVCFRGVYRLRGQLVIWNVCTNFKLAYTYFHLSYNNSTKFIFWFPPNNLVNIDEFKLILLLENFLLMTSGSTLFLGKFLIFSKKLSAFEYDF